ncbi:MAG: hypothetical protein E7028_10315 [Planctomycetaceae bacterium]|nr:hypothetical protein [Planctomycetaceae bacterium]
MLNFCVDVFADEIASYLSTFLLPEYFRNMGLERIDLNPKTINRDGTQPLRVTYSMPGRVEDLELFPEEHAFRIIRSIFPLFRIDDVQFIPDTSMWLWDGEKVTIYFMMKNEKTEPSGEIFPSKEVYLSFSRKEIFISFEVIQEYLAAQMGILKMDLKDDDAVYWDDSCGGVVYRNGNVKIQWILASKDSLDDILRFLGLDMVFLQVKELADSQIEIDLFSSSFVPEKGLMIPLRIRK